jgi:hypothetical protein
LLGGVSPGIKKPLAQAYIDREPLPENSQPTGPFKSAGDGHEGDLLIFVPRNEMGIAIDEMTGAFGYSHLAIDCGDIDQPTGRRVWIEATVFEGVHYAFQDEYGQRHFARISLRKLGLDVNAFCACVQSMLGEKYDDVGGITLGILDNPARQVCSDLATNCLPVEMRKDFVRCHRASAIHSMSAVLHARGTESLRLFISPNGFAEYFGTPRGHDLSQPDQPVEVHLPAGSPSPGIFLQKY